MTEDDEMDHGAGSGERTPTTATPVRRETTTSPSASTAFGTPQGTFSGSQVLSPPTHNFSTAAQHAPGAQYAYWPNPQQHQSIVLQAPPHSSHQQLVPVVQPSPQPQQQHFTAFASPMPNHQNFALMPAHQPNLAQFVVQPTQPSNQQHMFLQHHPPPNQPHFVLQPPPPSNQPQYNYLLHPPVPTQLPAHAIPAAAPPQVTAAHRSGSISEGGSRPLRKASTTSAISDSGSTQVPSSRAKGKRKRLDPDADDTPLPPGQEKPFQAPHGIPDTALYNHLQSQYQTIQEQLRSIAQDTHKLPASRDPIGPSLSNDTELLRELLEGFKETNDLIRSTLTRSRDKGKGVQRDDNHHPAKREKLEQEPAEDVDEDEDMVGVERPAESLPLVEDLVEGPSRRDKKVVLLAREVRRYFNAIFKGAVENPEHPATTENFVLDLTQPANALFNKAARKTFRAGFMSQDRPQLVALNPDGEDVDRLFISYFRNTRVKYRWAQLPMEDQEERKQAHRRQERKRNLYDRRLGAARRYKETKRHIAMIRALGVAGMSTDESDHRSTTGRPHYIILNKVWRNRFAAACLQTLDALHRDFRFRPIRRAGPGAQVHSRALGSKASNSPPVPGLPSALYDAAWLERQTPLTVEGLCVKESKGVYNFSHDAYIAELAKANNGKVDSLSNYV